MRQLILLTAAIFYIQPVYAQQTSYYNYHDPWRSPDGSQIIFYLDRPGNFDIYIMNADGTGLRKLIDDPSYAGIPDWSLDGKWILYNTLTPMGEHVKGEIIVIDVVGSANKNLWQALNEYSYK